MRNYNLRLLGAGSACLLAVILFGYQFSKTDTVKRWLPAGVVLSGSTETLRFVSPSGNDTTGDGSEAKPWASLSKAFSSTPDGSTVIVKDGVYDANQDNAHLCWTRRFSQTTTFKAENPYRAVLTNSSTLYPILGIYGCTNVSIENFEITRPNSSATGQIMIMITQKNGNVENVTLRNNIIHDSYNNDLLKINDYVKNVLVEGNVFYNQQGSDEHMDINGVVGVTVKNNIFFNDFSGSGRTDNDTSSFIVIKNSAQNPENRRIDIQGNIFLNWQGSSYYGFLKIGEDGYSATEAEDVLVENNLMIGNSTQTMSAPFVINGGKNITFRSNTLSGHFPGQFAGFALTTVGNNEPNSNVNFYNNIWSDPSGNMATLMYAPSSAATLSSVNNNLYWNNGKAISSQSGSVLSVEKDLKAIKTDPKLNNPTNITLPRWDSSKQKFLSGNSSIASEFDRLVRAYASVSYDSPAVNKGDPGQSPTTDILGQSRDSQPDIGAFEFVGSSPAPTPSDTTPPTISVTSPTANQVVSGTLNLQASASDNVGVVGVQFKLNGENLGSEINSAPYSYSEKTSVSDNGSYTLTAEARDAAGNKTVSSPVTFTIKNADGITNLSPQDKATKVATPVTLSWSSVSGASTYNVYYGRNSGSLFLMAKAKTNSYKIPILRSKTTYYWRITTGNISSPIWSFTTK